MSEKTPNLGLNIWNENDYVDFEEVNENFIKLDNIPVCIDSGRTVSSYTGGSVGTAEWYYKRYADNTVEMSTVLKYTDLRCDQSDGDLYTSNESIISFPFQFSKIYDVQMHLAAAHRGWVIDTTGDEISDHLNVRFVNTASYPETDWREDSFKQLFVSVKGVMVDA